MFSNCIKSIIRWRPLSRWEGALTKHWYASFSAKDIIYETSDEAGTLLARFAKHVALERLSICEMVPPTVRYADYFPITELNYFQRELAKTPVDQLGSVIVYAFTYRSNADPAKFALILNDIDSYAAKKVLEMDMDCLLRTLYAFLFLIPNWMTRLDFYNKAMQRILELTIQEGCKTKELFVQVAFYAGLSKKQTKNNLSNLWKTFLDSNMETFVDQFSAVDLALVSNAAYKTSTVIGGNAFNQRLLQEVLGLTTGDNGNDAFLITFIKSMRLQRLHSKEVCEHLTQIFRDSNKLQSLQLKGQIHIFAYLAENLWDSDDCTKPMISLFVDGLKSIGRFDNSQTVRAKDIDTFLWACAQLNSSLTDRQFHVVENCLLDKVRNKEFNYFPDQLVGSCLSLWILGFKSKELLHHAIQLKSISSSKRQQPKVDSRLTVLLSAAQIENPTFRSDLMEGFASFNGEATVPAYLLNSKEIPYQKLISELNQKSEVSSATISNPINGINIPGILVKLSSPSDSQIFIDFITPSQTLQFSRQPVSIQRLKLRLLQTLGYKVKVLSTADLCNTVEWDDLLNVDSASELSENSVNA